MVKTEVPNKTYNVPNCTTVMTLLKKLFDLHLRLIYYRHKAVSFSKNLLLTNELYIFKVLLVSNVIGKTAFKLKQLCWFWSADLKKIFFIANKREIRWNHNNFYTFLYNSRNFFDTQAFFRGCSCFADLQHFCLTYHKPKVSAFDEHIHYDNILPRKPIRKIPTLLSDFVVNAFHGTS